MAKGKNTYSTITEDIDYLEDKLNNIKIFLDDNPFHLIEDRMMVVGKRFDSDGNITDEYYKLAANREAQQKAILLAIKECAQLLEVLKGMREREEAKKEVRGGGDIPHRMRNGD